MNNKGIILISGGTGLIGKQLSERLHLAGYNVAILSTRSSLRSIYPVYYLDVRNRNIEPHLPAQIDQVIHLAGANIGEKRWTKKRKLEIIDSRVQTAQIILEVVQNQDVKIKTFISTSAIGYYGMVTSNKIFRETDEPGNDFLAKTCLLWEQAADEFEKLGVRTVKIRTGLVLSGYGGALKRMIAPIKFGVSIFFGKGTQWMPWIHIDDLCSIYIKAIEDNQMQGAYNAVAPHHITNTDFSKELRQEVVTPSILLKLPLFFLKIIFGEMAGIFLYGSRVSSEKIEKAGFEFKFSRLDFALKNLLIIINL